jgi:hypothetical protein
MYLLMSTTPPFGSCLREPNSQWASCAAAILHYMREQAITALACYWH